MIGTLSYDPGRVQCEDETQDAKQTFRLQEKRCEMNHWEGFKKKNVN